MSRAPTILFDPGNINAPRGSEPWCKAFFLEACGEKKRGQAEVERFQWRLKAFRDERYFAHLKDEKDRPFLSWEAFVQHREPFGLGLPLDVALAILGEKDQTRLLKAAADGGA